MRAGGLRQAIDSGKPFRLRSGDGALIDVPTRDHAFLNPSGQLVVVFTDGDGARVLDVALVTAIDYEKAPENLWWMRVCAMSPRRPATDYGPLTSGLCG